MARKMIAKAVVLLSATLGMMPAMADKCCYTADADSGELAFSGVVEGDSFRGQFEEFSVEMCLNHADLTSAQITVSVATASGDVGNRDGNQALKDEEFFAVERFPEATWKSTTIEAADNGYIARGELTIRDISAEQQVEMQLDASEDGFVLSGSAEIMRLDWQVGTGEFEDTEFMRNRIDLEFNLKLTEKD